MLKVIVIDEFISDREADNESLTFKEKFGSSSVGGLFLYEAKFST